MAEPIYGFSLIGCGAIAGIHAQAISRIKNAKLVGVFDFSPEYAKKFADKFGCQVFGSLEQLLQDPQTMIVCICTPSGLHAQQAIQAAQAKKHIIIEKPMAITKDQLEATIRAIRDNHVKAAVITQLRFTPAIQKLKTAIDEGRLGKILLADYRMKYYRSQEYYDHSNWRGTWEMDGGGALMNQGIHGIDLIQYLLGGVKSVYAQCRTLSRDIEVEDTANILVEYKNGAIGVIQGTTLAEPGYPRVIEVTGTKGTVIIKEDVIDRWDVPGDSETTTEQSLCNAGVNPMDFSEQYHTLQFMDLIEAIAQDRTPMVDEEEGRKPVDIILAAYESERTGKKVELE